MTAARHYRSKRRILRDWETALNDCFLTRIEQGMNPGAFRRERRLA